jgi:cobalt/nickel transport system permease protein
VTWTIEKRSQALLAGWLVAVFMISALTDVRSLAVASLSAMLVFRRGLVHTLRRVLFSVLPVTAALSAVSWVWLRFMNGQAPAAAPFFALVLRTSLIAFLTFAVLARLNLFHALALWPDLSRLLVVTLAQIHTLRLLATESRLGLRSRLLRKPGALDLVRGAGGISGALFTLATRNAREVTDALRSRGF